MALSKKEVEGLLRLVGLTEESELNCEQCLAVVAEFAELQLASQTISDSLQAVEHHLSICDECREEFEALLTALSGMDGDNNG